MGTKLKATSIDNTSAKTFYMYRLIICEKIASLRISLVKLSVVAGGKGKLFRSIYKFNGIVMLSGHNSIK